MNYFLIKYKYFNQCVQTLNTNRRAHTGSSKFNSFTLNCICISTREVTHKIEANVVHMQTQVYQNLNSFDSDFVQV